MREQESAIALRKRAPDVHSLAARWSHADRMKRTSLSSPPRARALASAGCAADSLPLRYSACMLQCLPWLRSPFRGRFRSLHRALRSHCEQSTLTQDEMPSQTRSACRSSGVAQHKPVHAFH